MKEYTINAMKALLAFVIFMIGGYAFNACMVSWAGPLNGIYMVFCESVFGYREELIYLIALGAITDLMIIAWVYGIPIMYDIVSKKVAK